MSNKDTYIRELKNIQASDAFRQRTKQLLLDELAAAPAPEEATPPRRRFPVRRLAALAACLVVVAGAAVVGWRALRPASVGMGGASQATLAPSPYAGENTEGAASIPAPGAPAGEDAPPVTNMPSANAEPDMSWLQPQEPAALPRQDLPPLPEAALGTGGMGFEGYMLYDFAEMGGSKPWQPGMETPEALPVYANAAQTDVRGFYLDGAGYTEAQLTAFVQETAAALGVTTGRPQAVYETAYVGDAANPGGSKLEQLGSVEAAFPGGSITAMRDGSIRIWFGTPRAADTTAFGQENRAAEQARLDSLIEEYGELLAFMQQPQANLSMQRNIYGDATWYYGVYDAAGGLAKQLAGQALSHAYFALDEENGQLFCIWLYRYDASRVVGEYPTLTLNEAAWLLQQGRALTTAPCDFPGMETLAGVELVYYTAPASSVFMPYYKFYALLDEEEVGRSAQSPEDLQTYGVWYVPAIRPEYLTELPDAQLYFNGGVVE